MTRRHRSCERGTTLIELAIVGVLVLSLFLAVFEFGLLFRDNLTATDAVADATRIGAIVGPDLDAEGATADYQIVNAVRDGLSAMNDEDVEYIVVFKATGTDEPAEDQLPPACKAGIPVATICNVYDAASAFEAVAPPTDFDYFSCGDSGDGPACPWDPTTRRDGPTSADVEAVGVYVKIVRGGYTKLFGNEWTITRALALRLEPGIEEP